MPRKKSAPKKIDYDLDSEAWEVSVKMVIMHTMLALYRTGYREINLAGLMLLMGMDKKAALSHSETFIQLDENFEQYVKTLAAQVNFESSGVPKDTVWH
jgi:hypothetical protein